MLITLALAAQAAPLPPASPVTPRPVPIAERPLDRVGEVNRTVHAIESDGQRVYAAGNFWLAGEGVGSLMAIGATDGRLRPTIARFQGQVHATAPDGAGGYFVAGNFTVDGSDADTFVRIRADGSVDDSLPRAPGIRDMAFDETTGTLYVVGLFYLFPFGERSGALAIDAATNAPLPWAPLPGVIGGGWPETVEVAAGKVWIGGGAMVDSSDPRYLLRCDPVSGAIDPIDFDFDGEVHSLDADGTDLFVSGDFRDVGGSSRPHVAAVDLATGALQSFRVDVAADVFDIDADGDDVYITGAFTSVAGVAREGIAAIDRSSAAVTSWVPDLSNAPSPHPILGYQVAVSGGRVAIGATISSVAGERRTGFAVVDRGDGTPVGPAFDMAGFGAQTAHFYAIDVVGDAFVLGGSASLRDPVRNQPIVAFDARTGRTDPEFVFTPGWLGVGSIELGPHALYVAGAPSAVSQDELLALDRTTGAPLPGFTADLSGIIGSTFGPMLRTDHGLVCVAQSYFPLRFRILAFDELTGARIPGLDVGPYDGIVHAIAVGRDPRVLYVGGEFDEIGTPAVPRRSLASLDLITGAVTGWAPAGVDEVKGMTTAPGAVYVVGRPGAPLAGVRDGGMAFDPLTGTLLPWAPEIGFFGTGSRSVRFSAGRVLISGLNTLEGSTFFGGAAVVDGVLGDTVHWAPAFDDMVNVARWVNGRPIVGGSFDRIDGALRHGLGWFDVRR